MHTTKVKWIVRCMYALKGEAVAISWAEVTRGISWAEVTRGYALP